MALTPQARDAREAAHGAEPRATTEPTPTLSIWPAAAAAGFALLLLGVVAQPAISVVGAVCCLGAVGAWIREISDER